MMIKVVSFTAMDAQRPHDLKSLLRYLVVGRGGSGGLSAFTRLFGPPFARHIIQRLWPFDGDFRLAAHDVSHQLFSRVRLGCFDKTLPRQVFAHVILSFAPRRRQRSVDGFAPVAAVESTYFGALRIVLDALSRLGVADHLPLFLVFHGDRRHLHAHAVVGLFAAGFSGCLVCELNTSTIWRIAKQVDKEFGLGRVTPGLRNRHDQVIDAFVNAESPDKDFDSADSVEVDLLGCDRRFRASAFNADGRSPQEVCT